MAKWKITTDSGKVFYYEADSRNAAIQKYLESSYHLRTEEYAKSAGRMGVDRSPTNHNIFKRYGL